VLGNVLESVLNLGPICVIGVYATEAEPIRRSARRRALSMRTSLRRFAEGVCACALLPLHNTLALVLSLA
jgi:hypothetical protein